MAKEITVGIVADHFDAAYDRDRTELVSEISQMISAPMQVRFSESKQIERQDDPEA